MVEGFVEGICLGTCLAAVKLILVGWCCVFGGVIGFSWCAGVVCVVDESFVWEGGWVYSQWHLLVDEMEPTHRYCLWAHSIVSVEVVFLVPCLPNQICHSLGVYLGPPCF